MPRLQVTWNKENPGTMPLSQVPLLFEQINKLRDVIMLTVEPHLKQCATDQEKRQLLRSVGVDERYIHTIIMALN